jgi:hypothetical protein
VADHDITYAEASPGSRARTVRRSRSASRSACATRCSARRSRPTSPDTRCGTAS